MDLYSFVLALFDSIFGVSQICDPVDWSFQAENF